MDRDEAIAELRRVKRQRERAEAARTNAAKATREAIIAALKAQIGPSEIATECGVTDSHVRAVRRDAKIPANPSYAKLKPPVRTNSAAATATPVERKPEPWAGSSTLRPALAVPSERELPTRYRELPAPFVGDTVKRIARGYPTWHEETRAAVAGAPLLFQDLLEIKRAHEAQILDELGIELP